MCRAVWLATALAGVAGSQSPVPAAERPHIIFVMADDLGWAQTGYRGHPVLKTPHLDAMAAAGLRFERFYAGGPVCSPTRATVLTGRTHDRCGTLNHGHALRRQEKTIAQALAAAGYRTAHFGKWHLNGLAGPGVPVLASDEYHPGVFGFEEWVSSSNYFDRDPLLGRRGTVEQFQGDSSEVIVAEAIRYLREQVGTGRPLFLVIWYGSPHSPWRASPPDRAAFASLGPDSAEHHGEIVAMDRSLGALRAALRELRIAENTLLVFCSDNGGLPKIRPDTVGGLRGHKGTLYEGGIRVPGIIEWPAVIRPRVTKFPACTMDLFPTVADILGLAPEVFIQPIDGISLRPLFERELPSRSRPIGFRYQRQAAWIADRWKLVVPKFPDGPAELYDLETDPAESRDLSAEQPAIAERMKVELLQWLASVEASFAGRDYPQRQLERPDPPRTMWWNSPLYQPYLEAWRARWEYAKVLATPRRGPREDEPP
ncbi:MAG: sulfatase-like hydrolase/transferase [Kiritimatiellae bacterium]|nr:sulfatase-like hydrolase/transferase [Kiritimatiellia bacterium]